MLLWCIWFLNNDKLKWQLEAFIKNCIIIQKYLWFLLVKNNYNLLIIKGNINFQLEDFEN